MPEVLTLAPSYLLPLDKAKRLAEREETNTGAYTVYFRKTHLDCICDLFLGVAISALGSSDIDNTYLICRSLCVLNPNVPSISYFQHTIAEQLELVK